MEIIRFESVAEISEFGFVVRDVCTPFRMDYYGFELNGPDLNLNQEGEQRSNIIIAQKIFLKA